MNTEIIKGALIGGRSVQRISDENFVGSHGLRKDG